MGKTLWMMEASGLMLSDRSFNGFYPQVLLTFSSDLSFSSLSRFSTVYLALSASLPPFSVGKQTELDRSPKMGLGVTGSRALTLSLFPIS